MTAAPDPPPPIARLTFAADPAFLPAALAFLRDAAGALGLPPDGAAGLVQAAEAVCRNVIEHGFAPGEPGTLDVILRRQPGEVVVLVEDRGMPFDFETLARGGTSRLGAPLDAAVDAVHFASLGNQGNRVELVKRLPFTHVEAHLTETEKQQGAPADRAAADVPVTLRLMTPDDAVPVARCTWRTYGYTAPDQELYFPDRMRELLAAGLLFACVGVTPDGAVVSYLAIELDEAGARVGNSGEAMVDPRFRGRHLFEQMKALLRTEAARRGMLGLYSEAVTVHPFSQKGNIALGASETGVQLGDEAPAVVFREIDAAAQPRRTATVLYYLRTGDGPRRVVHPPAHHAAMIRRIYGHGGFVREPGDPAVAAAAVALPAAAAVRVSVFPEWSEASLRVNAYGRDLADVVRARLRELCVRRIDWIGLDLPLGDPATAALCAPLEGLGFFFAGVVPELAEGDVLRLQYLNDVDVDVASAQIASAFGQELFDYVVRARGAAAT